MTREDWGWFSFATMVLGAVFVVVFAGYLAEQKERLWQYRVTELPGGEVACCYVACSGSCKALCTDGVFHGSLHGLKVGKVCHEYTSKHHPLRGQP